MRSGAIAVTAALSFVTTGALACGPAFAADWRRPAPLGSSDLFDGPPTVVTGRPGAILITRATANGAGAGYRIRLSGSAPFSAIRELIPECAACSDLRYRIAMNTNGFGIVAWQQFNTTTRLIELKATTLAPSGVRGPIETITTMAPSSDLPATAQMLALAIDTAGRAIVVSPDTGARPQLRTRASDGTWSSPITLAGPLANNADAGPVQIAVRNTHVAIAMPLADCTIAVARQQPDAAWTTTTLPRQANCDRAPAVSTTSYGAVHLIWYAWDGTHDIVKTASATATGAFGPATALGTGWNDGPRTRPLIERVQGGTVAVWTVPTARTLGPTGPTTPQLRQAVRTRTGTTWGAVQLSPVADTDHHTTTTIAPNGTVVTVATTVLPHAVIAAIKPFGAVWRATALGSAAPFDWIEVGRPATFVHGDVAIALIGRSADGDKPRMYEYTRQSLPLLTLPRPRLTALYAPKSINAGAVVGLAVDVDRNGVRVPVQIQQLRSGRWIVLANRSLALDGKRGQLFVRPIGAGTVTLRAVGGTPTRVVGPVRLTVRAVLRRRIPVGVNARQIHAGAAGVWVTEGSDILPASQLARRLSPTDGHTVRIVRTAGRLSDVAVGDGAAWLVDGGSALVRVDGGTGALTRMPIAGDLMSVSALGNAVWIGGVCPPSTTPLPVLTCGTFRQARQVNPASGTPTGVSADLAPTGHADWVHITGAVTWLAGESVADPVRTSALDGVAATTGARSAPPTTWGGTQVPLWPLTDTIVWQRTSGFRQVLPMIAPPITGSYAPIVDVARSGQFLWTLQQEPPYSFLPVKEKLVQRDLNGVPTGRTVDLGYTSESKAWHDGLAIHNNVAWVLQPGEATVIRVPLPTS